MFAKFLALPVMLAFAATVSPAHAAPDSGKPASTGGSAATQFVDPLRGSTTLTNPLGKTPKTPLVRPPQVKAVPEPSQWALMLGGLGLVGYLVRRGRRNAASVSRG